MWAHYIYLLLLPPLAVVSAQLMFPDSDFFQTLLILGFPPVLMFTLLLANGYAMPASLPVTLFVTLVIPIQIAASVFLFGGGGRNQRVSRRHAFFGFFPAARRIWRRRTDDTAGVISYILLVFTVTAAFRRG